MKKLKDKLIRWLGGYTMADMLVRTRPVKVRTFESDVRTLTVKHEVRLDMLEAYPDYIENYAKKDMAYRLGDRLMEDGLIKFSSREAQGVGGCRFIEVRADVKAIVPYE